VRDIGTRLSLAIIKRLRFDRYSITAG